MGFVQFLGPVRLSEMPRALLFVCVLPASQRPLDESSSSCFDFVTYIITWIEFRARQFGIWGQHRSMGM